MKTIELVGVVREFPAPDEHPDAVPLELLDGLAAAQLVAPASGRPVSSARGGEHSGAQARRHN